MRLTTETPPHLPARTSVSGVMGNVLLALVPGCIAMTWYFGWGVLINIAIASAVAIACEALVLRARGREVRGALLDLSAVVTAVLLALAIPPIAPWWVTTIGAAFAIVIAKQLFGGLGNNPFNPAMVGYVVVLISFPREMTMWLAPHMPGTTLPGLMDTLYLIFASAPPPHLDVDTLTMATPLDTMKTRLGLNETIGEISTSPLFGDFGGKGWEWVGNWFLLGGFWLLYRRIITWHVPVAMLGGLIFIALVFYLINPDSHPFPLFHVFSGGAIVGAFFIATDPVSGCTSNRGRLIFGAGVGVITYVIRTWGGYPDGVAFAILLMNMAAPAIDYYTRPRVFGTHKS